MGNSNDSGERLLGSYTERSNYGEELRFKGRSSACSWLKSNALSLLALIVLLYVAVIETINISLSYARSNNNEIEDQRPSLVKGVLRYEERPEWSMPQYPWNLEPSDALDTAWEDLLYALNVRISNNELSLLNVNQTNRVQVTGGNDDDYVGVLGVYHHLHCLNNIRRLLRWDYYGPKLTGEKHMEGFSPEHSGHCIDTIRQALMCHANTGLYTSRWDEETHMPSRNLDSSSATTCIKWDSLNDWARQRALRPGKYMYKPPRPAQQV